MDKKDFKFVYSKEEAMWSASIKGVQFFLTGTEMLYLNFLTSLNICDLELNLYKNEVNTKFCDHAWSNSYKKDTRLVKNVTTPFGLISYVPVYLECLRTCGATKPIAMELFEDEK